MRIVVTGALGHIGSALIRYLPLEFPEAEIVMIDNLHTQRYCSLFDLPPGNYKFIEADARMCKLPDHDVVVHLAAYSEPHADLDWEHNLLATHNVVQQAKRIIFPSTASVLLEPFPHTAYAAMKMREEELVRQAMLQHTIFRLGNLFGPSPGMRFHTVVSKLCWQAAHGQPLTVWASAVHQKRPYLDLTDACRAICFAISNECAGTYNMATEHDTVTGVISYISDCVIAKVTIVDKLSDSTSQEVSTEGFRKLGFKFSGSLSRGIHATMDLLRC